MRIGQFRVKVEMEVGIVLDLLVAEPDRFALLDEDSAQKRIEDRLDVLVQVLDQQDLTARDASEA
jgi:hypothetical protein